MGNKVYNTITGQWGEDKTTKKSKKISNMSSNIQTYNAITGEWNNSILPTKRTLSEDSTMLPIRREEQYVDTGKRYGDYFYQDYATRRNDKIYSKGGKYYVFNSKTNQYEDIDSSSKSTITTVEEQNRQKEEAKKLGYKDYYEEQDKKIKKLEDKYNSLNKKYDDNINIYTAPEKVRLAKEISKAKKEFEQAKKNNKYLSVSDRINLDTGNLTKKEYKEYSEDLQRQREKIENEQAEKRRVKYSGTGVDALKEIGTKAEDIAYPINKEVIEPIKYAKENYDIGKQNNKLALEYFNKMEGKKNNAEELEQKNNKFNRYNQDLITKPGAAGTSIQNMNTQVESLKRSWWAALPGAAIGGVGGFLGGGPVGAVAGAKKGFDAGYTLGSAPYTYKLEAGNTYKDLTEQGIPKNIAKDLARKTGVINAAIESGEKVLDIITWGRAGKLKDASEQMLYDELKKEYGEKALKTFLVKAGYSYAQNVASESMEEMAQEGTSILAEREAYKKAGMDRPVTDEEDIKRVLAAGKSAAISTAFTAPLTAGAGTISQSVFNNLRTQAINNVNTLTNTDINTEITNQIINYSKENNTNLTEGEVLQIKENVKNNLEQNNVTVIDNQNNVEQTNLTQQEIKQKIKDLTLELKSYEQVSQNGTFVGATDEVITELRNEINNLQQQLKNQPNIPTVQDIVNQEKNQQARTTNNLNEYIEDVSTREALQNEKNKQSVRESILEYLDDKNITNPTKSDMMDAMDWYDAYDTSEDLSEINNTERLYSEVADELLRENNSSEQNNQSSLSNDSEIQGMKVTKTQVEDAVYSKFDEISSEYGFDIDNVEGVYLHGSRLRGTANLNSDLDAVVFYIGNESEDYIFNTINDKNNQLVIDGVKVDINPVSIDNLSEINDYIEKSEAYDNQIINNTERQENINNSSDNVVIQEIINNFENAKGSIDRNTLLKVADTLEIYHKAGTKVITDETMLKRAGHNINPKIIDVSIFNKTGKLSQLTREINNLSRELYTNNKNGYTLVDNIDTNIDFELGKLGIDKTFSKNVPFEKLPTFNKLKEIGEQGLYYKTTYNSNKNDGILYHHFLTPVKAINNEGNAFIRTVIKEYTKDNNMNKKFYYHQMEYLDNKKGTTDTSHIGTRNFGNSHDNNITQINENVKLLPTNNDMQKGENNTINLPTNEDMDLLSLESTAPTEENNTLDYIPQDPTRESSYDNDAPNFWELDNNKDSLSDPITEFARALDREIEENTKTPKQIKETNNLKSKAETMWSDFQEKFVNRNYEIDKLAKKSGNKEIMFKGDMLNSVAGETSGDINVAQTDNNGKRIGGSLKSLFENSKKKGYYEQFDDYLKHYSNIDRHGYGKGSVVPLDYSQKMVKAYEQSIPGIKNEANKVWKYGKNLLNNMEENGLISKELRGTLEELYPHYVPYMQSESMVPYMDDSGEIKPKKVIKSAKGGADNLITIEEAFEKYTYATKKAIRQNDLYKEIVKTSKEKVSFGADDRVDPTQLDGSLMKDAEGNGYVTAYIDGMQQQAKVSNNLYQELTKTNEMKVKETEAKYSPIVKPLQKISGIRRNILTTWNPSFIATNAIKDIQDGLFNSKYTTDMVKNYPSAFIELATQNTETAQQFASLYGSGMVMGDYQIDSLSKAAKNMDINQLNKLIKALPNANEIVELAPRYAEFKASLENGCSVTEAMYNAREITTNFNRGGYITKALNRDGFTFLNASVQGFDKLIRNLTGQNGSKGVAVGVAGIMTKVAVLGIAPAMFNAMAFGEGEDDEDEAYKALPDYIKDNYYLFKIKGIKAKNSKYYDGEFLRIPKGRVLSIFGSAARRTLEYSKGDKNAFDGYLKNVESQVGINNPEENNIIAPIKQAFGSKNGEAWYGGDLVPKRLQNKPITEQYDEGTDEFSKWLGKMINVSPYKINYLLDQYSGGAGDIVLPMITKDTTNGATTTKDYLIAPIKDKFIVNSTDDNKYASKFYTKLETIQTKNNAYNVSETDKLKYKYMSSISSDMSKLYKEKREIQLDDSLTKKQKYKKVQSVQKEINKLAEEGIKEPKIKDLKSHYVKVENTEYYKNSKGSWTIIKDEEASELNSLRMSANEKSNYFKVKNKIGTIRTSDIESSEKKDKISNLIVNMNMSDDKLAYLYGKYYSNEKTLDMIQNAGISMKEFIKYNNQSFESNYYNNGRVVKNSKLAKIINYVNTLNLNVAQKAILIKMKSNSYKKYDKQIVEYLNNQNISYLDKVTNMNISKEEKIKLLKDMGFTIRNGRVYS